MLPEILPLPQIPDGLREAQQTRGLVPFIGAGVSRLAGCPDWTAFADGALDQMIRARCLNHSQVEQLKNLTPRVKLSIARAVSKGATSVEFGKILHQGEWQKHEDGRRVYAAIGKLAHQFVTTNYDEWLDIDLSTPDVSLSGELPKASQSSARSRHPFYRHQDFTPNVLSIEGAVVHLHGSVRDPSTMILTQQDYVSHYANDRQLGIAPERENRVLTFLDHLFRNRSVLFLGYGLEELEILEYVILKGGHKNIDPSLAPRHFVLQGFFNHQGELMRHMQQYYQVECGLLLIPFSRDDNNYGQLINVLETWATNLPASKPLVLQQLKEMENLLDD